MKLGISSYSYGWSVGVPGHVPEKPIRVADLLLKAEEFAVNLVQIGDNLPLHTLSKEELDQIKKLSIEKGIDIEVGTRGFTPENIRTYLELASYFQSPILRMVTDMKGYEPSPEEIVAISKDLLPELEKRNVILAIENHDRFRAKVLASIIDTIGSEYIGICLDTVNSMGAAEGVETIVETLGSLTVNLHVKDFEIARFSHLMGFTITGTPAGQGMLNVPWLLETLKSRNRKFNAILELWTPPEADLTETIEKEQRWVEESIPYLRQFILD
jgi:sugar phosphate isomerase/epimerase